MATADITLEQFQTELGAAKTALDDGDYTTAKRQASMAQITLSGLIGSMSAAGRSYQLQQEQLANLLAAIDVHERTDSSKRSAFTRGFPV